MSSRAMEEDRNLGQYCSKNSKEDFTSAGDNGKPIFRTLDPHIVLLKVGGR